MARAAQQTPPPRPRSDARAIATAHLKTTIIQPALAGPVKLDVGVSTYAIPKGSRVAHHADEPIAYVLTPQGGLHVISERGELTGVAPAVLATIRRVRFQT
ncbi:hypothetical protein [Microbacterium stercoris]|uniref:Uncharacterized protein n=1 Tax=Microbacterium stercoris TaxID=2820289 RepID=A0A939TXV9_9MICO|nr:hypothetical protein [Microbacterium stercoris]MBO3664067.1 hypothetical protein [Microbacterium stercoris]